MLSDCFYPQFVDAPRPASPPIAQSTPTPAPIKLELGLIHNVSGSAYLDFGGSKVICSVHGPYARAASGGIFSSTGTLECDFKYASSASVSEKTSTVQPQTVVDALQSSICLEKYAKMTIAISIVVLETQGCELAHAICCASLALLQAGVEMKDLVCASSAVKQSDGTITFDPTREQIAQGEGGGCVTVATTPTTGDVTQIVFDGKEDLAVTFGMIQQCSERNVTLRQSFRDKILSQQQQRSS
jgi:exosome complex component MTR3